MKNILCKFEVVGLIRNDEHTQNVRLMAVTEKPFDKDGNSDDNLFARWTPTGSLDLFVTNPDVIGFFVGGERYYVLIQNASDGVPTALPQNETKVPIAPSQNEPEPKPVHLRREADFT